MHRQWEDAANRERRSHTMFAQEPIAGAPAFLPHALDTAHALGHLLGQQTIVGPFGDGVARVMEQKFTIFSGGTSQLPKLLRAAGP